MKLITYILTVFIVITSLTASCDSALNIEPEDVLVEDDVFSDPDLASQALGQAYIAFFEAATGYAYTIGDFSTDIAAESENLKVFSNGEVRPSGFYVELIWTEYYAAINLANTLIKKIPAKGAYSEKLMAQHIAEARFLRAFEYFNLLILYGQGALNGDENGLGLPLRLDPFEGYKPELNIPRSTTAEVYEQIINDLTSALADLPIQYDADVDTRSRATKGSVKALLSRIYLYRGDYKKASEYAQQILDNSLYSLVSSCLELFPPHPDQNVIIEMPAEYIFGFPVSVSDLDGPSVTGGNDLAFTYYYKRTLWANEAFIEMFEAGDFRKSELIFEGWDEASTPQNLRERRTTFKFNNRQGQDNVPMIRLAEVMLTQAEALARLSGINSQSIALLNEVRGRGNPSAVPFTAVDFTSKQQLIDRILLERKLELAFEGHQRYDLIRTGRPLGNPPLSVEKHILPIPEIDIKTSAGIIEQNPGY